MANQIESFISKLKNMKDFQIFEEDGGAPGNVTSNIDGYETPNAFSKDEEENLKHTKDNIDVYGYSIVDKSKKKKNFESTNKTQKSNESAYKQLIGALHEVSYKQYKTDQSKPVSHKINGSIKEINRTLREIERAVGHASKLKTEMAIDQRTFWKSSRAALVKISEKLVRIGKKINELGA